jgi:hypothetical protein
MDFWSVYCKTHAELKAYELHHLGHGYYTDRPSNERRKLGSEINRSWDRKYQQEAQSGYMKSRSHR